ncbi:MAG: Lar family restriction alleviation protein [Patescibacteria group bacterium]|nr:Lar family restriction alleviation protein [Patescibacteria group bacterium]
MTDLLPCPFCGGRAVREDVPGEADDEIAGASYICCARCNASTALYFDRKENLVSSWNDRWKGPTLDARAFALFRAWADKLPTEEEARYHWDTELSPVDQAEWRRRVIEYEDFIASAGTDQ